MSSHINVALKALGTLDAVLAHRHFHYHYILNQLPRLQPLESSSSLQLLWSEAVSSSSKLCSISYSNRHFILVVITTTDCCFRREQNAKAAMKKQSLDIWRWCHTPFESYRTQLRDDNDNIRFMVRFLVRETHKAVCAIRDCKKPRFQEERKINK